MSQTLRAATDHGVMRKLNRSLVVDIAKRQGPISRAQIAKETQLAKPTVSAIVEGLVIEGVLREVGIGPASSSGGRRPILYTFDPRSQYVLGIHIGVDDTAIAIADAVGGEVAREVVSTPAGSSEKALAAVVARARALFQSSDLNESEVAAIGICVPGLVDPTAGLCVLAPNLGWRDVDLTTPFSDLADCPVYVHNVAQAVLVAEHVEGAAQDVTNAVLLYEDNGVGAAILVDGHLFHGANGIAGEIGHCKLPHIETRCACGAAGCLETQTSVPAIVRRITGNSTGSRDDPRHELQELASRGDAAIDADLRDAGHDLGYALAWLVNLVNPQVAVVAGGFLAGGPELTVGITERLTADALPAAADGLEVRRSDLGADAPIRGAVLLALQTSDRSYQLVFEGPPR